MSLRRAFREIAAAKRWAARNEQRRERHLERSEKPQAKIDEITRAAADIEECNGRINRLLSIHHEVEDPVNKNELDDPPQPMATEELGPLLQASELRRIIEELVQVFEDGGLLPDFATSRNHTGVEYTGG